MIIRLTPEEHEQARMLARTVGAPSVSAFVRAKPVGDDGPAAGVRISPRYRQRMLAEILVRLGRSDALSNLKILADAAQIGALPASPDVVAEIREGVWLLADLRRLLMASLGAVQLLRRHGDIDCHRLALQIRGIEGRMLHRAAERAKPIEPSLASNP